MVLYYVILYSTILHYIILCFITLSYYIMCYHSVFDCIMLVVSERAAGPAASSGSPETERLGGVPGRGMNDNNVNKDNNHINNDIINNGNNNGNHNN